MTSMPINDRRLIKPIVLICFSGTKFLLKVVNVLHFSNDHYIVSSLIGGCENKPHMEFLDPFFKFLKSNLGLGQASDSMTALT